MNLSETAVLLGLAAARDQRTVGETDVRAWHEDLEDIDFDDARQAITRHYRESTDRLMPAHVRRLVAEIVRERRREVREAREAAEEERLTIGRGPVKDRSAEVTALIRQAVAALPVTPSDAIHQRAKDRARAENGRPEPPKPARKRKGAPTDWAEPQTDDIAKLATRYLLDGHDPNAVAERLAVSRKWCRKTARKFTRDAA